MSNPVWKYFVSSDKCYYVFICFTHLNQCIHSVWITQRKLCTFIPYVWHKTHVYAVTVVDSNLTLKIKHTHYKNNGSYTCTIIYNLRKHHKLMLLCLHELRKIPENFGKSRKISGNSGNSRKFPENPRKIPRENSGFFLIFRL